MELWKVAQRKLDRLRRVTRLEQIAVPPGNRLETLAGDCEGQYGIRISDRYRICFVWTDRGAGGGRDHGLSPRHGDREATMSAHDLPGNRPPTHPGEMLRAEFLEPLGIPQTEFAERIGVSYVRLNAIVNRRRGVTPNTALRRERATGMDADFRLGLQADRDLWHELHSPEAKEIEKIERLPNLAA